MGTQPHVLNGQERMQSGKWGEAISNLLVVVAWFGLLTGTVEGVASLVMQRLQWQALNLLRSPSPENVWICPLFDLFLAAVVGFVVFLAARIFPRLPARRLAVFLLTTMMFYDWLTLSGSPRGRKYLIPFVSTLVAGWFTQWFERHQAAVLSFWRRTLLRVALLTVLATGGVSGVAWLWERHVIAGLPPVSTAKPLNVVVVVIDTLRADHLSAYGYTRPTSPNLNQLAEQGVFFENAFAGSSWTLPSHASLLTGRFPHQHGADRRPYDGRWPTLAQEMRSRGYLPAAFSANTTFFCRRSGFGGGFVHFEDYTYSIPDLIVRTNYGRFLEYGLRWLGLLDGMVRRDAPSVSHAALQWVDNHRDRPFLIFLNYSDVHDTFAPPAYRTKFSKSGNLEKIVDFTLGVGWPSLTTEQQQGEIDGYDAAIAYVDSEIGALVAELKKRGLSENTVIVITADHGQSLGEHGIYGHGFSLYMQESRVPLLFLGPAGLVPQNVRIQVPVSNVALPATLMDLLGISDEGIFPGPSLRNVWGDPTPTHDRGSCVESDLAGSPTARPSPVQQGSLKALVTPQWHYILHEKLGPELYDWHNDPGELRNLIFTPEGKMASDSLKPRLESGCW
jgi:arylsulfatase A-like enzyme